MIECYNCGKINDDDANFCNKCGVNLKDKKHQNCDECGYTIIGSPKFCTECGSKIRKNKK
ncbi:MAG: zinc ribbon domain-containing protein [Candidatus Lokiarchaeia archaeon]|nr:zinc ribbon domain-containing protein [Candidatus Lokiarchaeia archaeon]